MNSICKTIIAGCLFMLLLRQGEAQTIVHIGAGGQMFIGAKATVSFDSLLIAPSSKGFLLGENNISKLPVPINPFPGAYIKRVYCFSKPVPDYSGSLGIFYNDKDASDIDENKLLLQAYTGYAWHPQREIRGRNGKHNAVGVLGVHHLSFSELLAGYGGPPDPLPDPDTGGRKAMIALAPAVDAQVTIAVYPNPAVRVVNIQVNGSTAIKSIQLYNAAGKLLLMKEGSPGNRCSFNISSFAAGHYTILAETGTGKISKPFIKE